MSISNLTISTFFIFGLIFTTSCKNNDETEPEPDYIVKINNFNGDNYGFLKEERKPYSNKTYYFGDSTGCFFDYSGDFISGTSDAQLSIIFKNFAFTGNCTDTSEFLNAFEKKTYPTIYDDISNHEKGIAIQFKDKNGDRYYSDHIFSPGSLTITNVQEIDSIPGFGPKAALIEGTFSVTLKNLDYYAKVVKLQNINFEAIVSSDY